MYDMHVFINGSATIVQSRTPDRRYRIAHNGAVPLKRRMAPIPGSSVQAWGSKGGMIIVGRIVHRGHWTETC